MVVAVWFRNFEAVGRSNTPLHSRAAGKFFSLVACRLRSYDRFQLLIVVAKQFDDLWIISFAGFFHHELHRLIQWECAAILPVRSQGIEAINGCKNAGPNWYFFALKAVRITGPVPLFMVRTH